MKHAKFEGHLSIGSGEEVSKGFHRKWARRPNKSYALDRVDKFSFTPSLETLYEIWLQLAQGLVSNVLIRPKMRILG